MGELSDETNPGTNKVNLESIIDAEMFPEPKNNWEKLKQGVEKFAFHNKNKILVPLSAALGVASDYISYYALQGLESIAKITNPHTNIEDSVLQMSAVIGLAVGCGTYILLNDKIRERIGKKICGVSAKAYEKPKGVIEGKKNFFQKHKVGLALASSAAYLGFLGSRAYLKIASLPATSKKMIEQNLDAFLIGTGFFSAACFGVNYLFFHVLGQGEVLKNPDLRKQAYGAMLYQLSKKEGIEYWKRESQRGNIYANAALARYAQDAGEKLEYTRMIIEKIQDEKIIYGPKADWVKFNFIGGDYTALKKKRIDTMISIASTAYSLNPPGATRILDRLGNTQELDIKPEIILIRNYLMNAHSQDKPEHWEELLAEAEKKGILKEKKGSEGRIQYFEDKFFLKKNFIGKRNKEDKTSKFLAEKAIHKILQGTEIRFENPLFIYNKGEEQIQIFLREGEKDLREALDNKSVPEKRMAFEKAVRLLLNYQEKVFSAIQKKDGEFILNSEYRGNKQEIIIPLLDLEKNLMIRAFIGLRKEGKKLGENEYLPALMDKLMEQNQGYNKQSLTFNHGDALAQNITETLCIIDPWPIIAHSYYDITNLAADPVFLALDFQSRKETVLEATMKGSSAHFNEREQEEGYDIFYLRNALCRTGSLFYHNRIAETGMILNELIQFVRKKPFEREVMLYLKNSNVKGLMKDI